MIVDYRCEICGNRSSSCKYKGRDRFYGVEGLFDIFKCDRCGLLSIFPKPNQEILKLYYPSNYYSYSNTDRIIPKIRSLREKIGFYVLHPINGLNCVLYSRLLKLKDLLIYKKGFKVLDIGCGDGFYLLAKSQQGCECFGIDIDEPALKRFQKKNSSISTFCGNIWDAGLPDETFDIVNLDNVLEHITEPERLLDEVKRVMTKKGRLRFVVPNSASLTHEIFRSRWMPLDCPRHIHTFSIKNLKSLLTGKGFAICNVRTIEGSFDFLGSMIYLFNDIFKTNYRIMDCVGIWDNELIKLLFFPYAALVNCLRIGDTVEFIARKG